jgi:hypothetical protein
MGPGLPLDTDAAPTHGAIFPRLKEAEMKKSDDFSKSFLPFAPDICLVVVVELNRGFR